MKKLHIGVLLTALLLLLAMIPAAQAADAHPGLMTITSGVSVGDDSYINHDDPGYPFRMTFQLDEATMPLQSCRLGIYSWDCDEVSSTWHYEYDMVYVNGVFVGVLTGQNATWKTSYFEVPLSALKMGENEIVVYVGHKDKETGTIVRDTDYWLLTIDWASLQFDGGMSENAPETFQLSLEYAVETENGIQCGAKAYIVSETTRSYVIEYSLVDKTDPSSPTYGQIIADDEEYLTGTTLNSTGFFDLGDAPKQGTYVIQCTLRDPVTHEVYDYEELSFDMDEALNGGCDHVPAQENTLIRTAYRLLSIDDPAFSAEHEQQDIFWNICAECNETFNIFSGWERAAHTEPVCACGYVIPGYDPIKSATLAPVKDPYVGCDYVITVVTDENVGHLEAINNNGYGMYEPWSRSEMGDGTVRWTAVYRPTTSVSGRYWTITAYNVNNRAMSSIDTNPVDIGVGQPTLPVHPAQTTATYTIRVLDKKTAAPISGASVQLCGQVLSTDAAGNAVFDWNALGRNGLAVSVPGSKYHMVDQPDFAPSGKGGMTIIQLTDERFAFTKALCNNDDVLSENSQINTEAELMARFDISLAVSNGAVVNGYKLMQGDTVLGESKDGKFTIDNKKFTVGQRVRAVADVTYNSGQSNTIEEELKITVVAFGQLDLPESIRGILDFLGRFSVEEFEVGKGDEDKVLGKIANALLKFANKGKDSGKDEAEIEFPFEIQIDNEKITLAYNVDKEEDGKLNANAQKVLDDFNKKHEKSKAEAGKGIAVEITFCLNAHFNENGLHAVSGGVGVSVGLTAEADVQTAIGPVPVLLEAEGSLKGVGTANDFGYDLVVKKLLTPEIGVGVHGQITLSVGVGFKILGVEASAGVYGTLGAELDSTFTFDAGGAVDTITFTGEVGINAEVDIGPFEYETKLRIWPGNGDGGKKVIRLNGRCHMVLLTAEGAEDSLAARFGGVRKQASSGVLVSDVDFTDAPAEAEAMPTHNDPDAEPQLASAGDVTMMVFLDTDGDQADTANTTHLVYSLWNGTAWGKPIRIDASDVADGPFKLYSDGKNIYLAYMKLNRLLEAGEMPNTAGSEAEAAEKLYAGLSHFDVYVSRFEPGLGFLPMGRLTADEMYDFSADLTMVNGTPAVAFIKSGDTLQITDQNALCLSLMAADGRWETRTLLDGSLGLSGAKVGLLGGQVYVAAVQETEDPYVFNLLLSDENGQLTIVDSGLCASPVFGEVNGQQQLLWYSDGAVKRLTAPGGAAEIVVAAGAGADLALCQTGAGTLLTFSRPDGMGQTELCGMLLNGGQPVALVTDAAAIFAYDVLPLSNGVFAAWRSAAASADGLASTMRGAYLPFGPALTDAMISYDESGVQSGAVLPVAGFLYNGGMEPITAVTVLLDGAEAETIPCTIRSGEWVEVLFNVQLPEEMKGAVEVAFSAENAGTTAAIGISLERIDFALIASDYYLADREHLQYSVQNVGTVDAGVTMQIRADDENGEVIYTMPFELESQYVVNDLLDIGWMLGMTQTRTLYVELVSSGEGTLDNNAAFVHYPVF